MDNIDDIYSDMIIEYGINPPHKEKLKESDYCELGHLQGMDVQYLKAQLQ